LLTKSPALEVVSKPVPQIAASAQIVSAPDAVPAAPHA
jgi:acetyl-CoA carboxylase carboxyl transferase subunit beta